MSEAARKLFEGMKSARDAVQAVAPGLKDVAAETKLEASRLGMQGASELASALFGGSNSFVPYGPGQITPKPEHEQQRGGMER